MCCAEFIVKYVLFLFNLLCLLAGLALIAAGVAGLYSFTEVFDLIPLIEVIPITLMVVGSVVLVIAFFGCCGAIKESRCLLIMYVVCMLVVGILVTILTVITFRALNNVEESVTQLLTDTFESPDMNVTFHVYEKLFTCCGTTGADAYNDLPYIPGTCCNEPTDYHCNLVETSDLYDGCITILSNYMSFFGKYISYGLLGVIGVVVIGAIFGLFLNARITQKNRKAYY